MKLKIFHYIFFMETQYCHSVVSCFVSYSQQGFIAQLVVRIPLKPQTTVEGSKPELLVINIETFLAFVHLFMKREFYRLTSSKQLRRDRRIIIL